jgi:light-regulated signal transduction histidine kinase (bacteriophytochrome)
MNEQRHQHFGSYSGFKPGMRATARIAAEEPPRCTALTRDVAGRKRAEETIWKLNGQLERRFLERSAQLEAANNELEALSHFISYDLHMPLRHVVAFVEILQRDAAPSLSDASKAHLDGVAAGVRKLDDLVNALEAFSGLGRSEMRQLRVSLAALLDEARRDLRYDIEGRRIAWEIHDLPEVDGDPILLRQVIASLLSNALKYTRSRAESKIEIGALDGKFETVVFVRDNGVGFDMKCVDKLFGVFQRLHPASEFGGTGIGLATVQRIVRRHGGRAWAEGVVDGGATFYFSLPKLKRQEH